MDMQLEEYLRRRRGVVSPEEEDVEFADPGDMDRSLSPEPLALRERPRFDNLMAGLDAPRLQAEADVALERSAADELADVAGRSLGRDGTPLAAGDDASPARKPMLAGRGAPAPDDEGSGGGYLAALRRAQRMDELTAGMRSVHDAQQKLAEVTSRGAWKAQPLGDVPSEVGKELQRRSAVAEYLKQKRDGALADADIRLKNAHADFYEKPKPTAPAKPGQTQTQIDDKTAAEIDALRALAEARRRGTAPHAGRPVRDFVGEKKAQYERQLQEGIPAGWELQPGAQPTQKQREEAAKIVISRGMVDETLGQVRKLLATPGAVANPRVRELLAQQGEFIKTQLRVLEDLGVPSGPDAQILGRLIGSPESLVGEALDSTQQKLDALGNYVGKRVDLTAKTYGLQRKQAAPPADGQSKPAEGAGTVRVKRKSDGAVVEMPTATAEKLVKAKLADLVP